MQVVYLEQLNPILCYLGSFAYRISSRLLYSSRYLHRTRTSSVLARESLAVWAAQAPSVAIGTLRVVVFIFSGFPRFSSSRLMSDTIVLKFEYDTTVLQYYTTLDARGCSLVLIRKLYYAGRRNPFAEAMRPHA
jgi:hypothetical protein